MSEIKNIIQIEDKKVNISWGMNSQGFLYLKNLELSGISLMDEIALSKRGLAECIRIMNEYNLKEDKKEKK